MYYYILHSLNIESKIGQMDMKEGYVSFIYFIGKKMADLDIRGRSISESWRIPTNKKGSNTEIII